MCPHEFNMFLGFSILTCTPAVNIAVVHVMELSGRYTEAANYSPVGQIWSVVCFCTAEELRIIFKFSKIC